VVRCLPRGDRGPPPDRQQQWLNIDFVVTQFLGGTGLLIVVSVALDFLQRVEATLLMRNYEGFLGDASENAPRLPTSR
jgi:hypothetical protein